MSHEFIDCGTVETKSGVRLSVRYNTVNGQVNAGTYACDEKTDDLSKAIEVAKRHLAKMGV